MVSRLFGSILFLVVLYVMAVFVLPDIADTYWDKGLNAKIREYKDRSLQFASGSDSATSLFGKITESTSTYIESTKKSVQTLEATVNTKVNQVQEASSALENAYSGIMDATHKIQNLTGSGQ